MTLPAKLGVIFVLSELTLGVLRRSGTKSKRHDAGSLTVLWITITLAVTAGAVIANVLPTFRFQLPPNIARIVGPMFALGLVVRWWAILSLGRFFTVDVSIAPDHELIVRGPYRVVRHPSYTGLLLAFVTLAVTFQNWLSLACILIPISLALTYRIYVEEIALEATFGEAYHEYARSTKRLIPGVF